MLYDYYLQVDFVMKNQHFAQSCVINGNLAVGKL